MTRFPIILLAALPLWACGSKYSADEYSARAVQQANPVQQGVIAGSRRVAIAAGGEAGAAAGAAAGGVLGGAAAAGNSVSGALGAVGGALVGGLVGSAAERSGANTDAVEYLVRRNDGELVSITQRDAVPIPLGTRVLVITGNQARVVPDYTGSAAVAPNWSIVRRGGAPAVAQPAPAVSPITGETSLSAPVAPRPETEPLAPPQLAPPQLVPPLLVPPQLVPPQLGAPAAVPALAPAPVAPEPMPTPPANPAFAEEEGLRPIAAPRMAQ